MKKFACFLIICCSIFSAEAQQRVKMMHYNLLQFGNACNVVLDTKTLWLSSILNYAKPDILTVNELGFNTAYSERIKLRGFTYTTKINYGEITNRAGSQIINNIFYNTDLFNYKGVEVITGGIRDINVYKLEYKPSLGLDGKPIELYCIVAHFRASADQSAERAKEAKLIMDWIALNGKGKNVILSGDLNLESPFEDAFQALVKNPDPAVQLVDPLNKLNGWAAASNAAIYTQSTRDNVTDCGVAGGLDDRFDFILPNNNIMSGTMGIQYVQNTYTAVGNDGTGFNRELNCNGNLVPAVICANLKLMSDHLPLTVELDFNTSPVQSIQEELSEVEMSIENPVSDRLLIAFEYSKPISNYTLEVMDWTGRIIEKKRISSSIQALQLPVNWEQGMYIVRLSAADGRRRLMKIVKQ